MSAQDHAAMAREVYQAFNRSDFDAALALAADDGGVVLVPFGKTFHGKQGFREFMAGFKDAFPDLTVTVTNQVATDDQVVNECSWTGTHTGPLQTPTGTIPPTNKRVEGAVFCEVWGIRDGKVARLVNYQDAATWLRQLGLVS